MWDVGCGLPLSCATVTTPVPSTGPLCLSSLPSLGVEPPHQAPRPEGDPDIDGLAWAGGAGMRYLVAVHGASSAQHASSDFPCAVCTVRIGKSGTRGQNRQSGWQGCGRGASSGLVHAGKTTHGCSGRLIQFGWGAESNIPAGWGAWKLLKRLYFVLDIARVEDGMLDCDITGLKPAQLDTARREMVPDLPKMHSKTSLLYMVQYTRTRMLCVRPFVM